MADPPRLALVGHGTRSIPGVAPEVVRVELLGGFRVSVGPRTIGEDGWRLRKARSLVALLALEPYHRMHRGRLMDLLWPELDAGAAANNLRYALHVARRTLEPVPAAASHYLCLRGELLALCSGGQLRVDVEAFERAAATARRLREPAAYRAAIELYAGELLPGDRYEGWAEDRREGLRRDHLTLLVELARLHEERGELGPAIEALRRVVIEERTREGAHVGLMRLHALAGRRDEALKQYERLREALSRELGRKPDVPGRHLHQEILAGRFPPTRPQREERERPADDRRHNLPAPRNSFVGREGELVEVGRLLAMTRLLTLTGAGGSGKTRLALEAARDLAGAYPGGVWLVELAGLSEGVLVAQAFAGALGVREQPGRPLADTMVDALRERSLLLVVDNCEHLVDEAARMVETLLDHCPDLRVLATSREVLGVAGELAWRVPSLSLPDPRHPLGVGDLWGYGSARLFVERARNRRPGFEPTPENVRAVAEICHRLDGIPLAIELAAARMGVLSAGQIAERLGDSLGLLTGGGRAAPPRHKTLRGALEWSHDLLSEPERKLFRRLSAFAGGFTLEAAEAVGSGRGIEEGDVLDLLSRLVDKSLVAAEAGAEDTSRYRLLEPVRQYGRGKLESTAGMVALPEAERVRGRHAAWFLSLAEEAESKGIQQAAWLERLEREHDNLRAALSWSLERGKTELGLRLSGTLGEFWYTCGHLDEGRRWLEAALANGGSAPASTRIKALAGAGYIAWEQGDYDRATQLGEEGLALSRESGDRSGVAAALLTLGTVALHRNECEQASALLEEALGLRRGSGDTVGVGRVLLPMGLVAVIRGDFGRAQALHEEGLSLARETADKLRTMLLLGQGALAYLGLGDYQRTRMLCAEGLELSRELGHVHGLVFVLHVSAVLSASEGRPVRSALLWGAAEALRETIGATLSPASRHHYGPYIAAARARLDEASWEAALVEGRAMTPEGAIEFALSGEDEPTRAPTPHASRPPASLTGREREVAVLVARGLTNRRISTDLAISERTVDAHLRKILKKLGLHSRTQVAAWAAKQGLLP